VVPFWVKDETRWRDEKLVENGLAWFITQPMVLADGT
jgi:hypothetical protein